MRNCGEKTVAGAKMRFDVIIELWFEDERGWKEAIAAMDTSGGRALQADEESFMDRPGDGGDARAGAQLPLFASLIALGSVFALPDGLDDQVPQPPVAGLVGLRLVPDH